MSNDCNICLEEAEVPHAIEKHKEGCEFIYCYLCISRHLRCRDTCPSCGYKPVSRFDLYFVDKDTNLDSSDREKTSNFNSRNNYVSSETLSYSMAKKEETVKKILKKYRIRLDGSKTILENRFFELVDLLYMQKFRQKALSNIEIAWRINRQAGKKAKRKIDVEIIRNLLELKKQLQHNRQS